MENKSADKSFLWNQTTHTDRHEMKTVCCCFHFLPYMNFIENFFETEKIIKNAINCKVIQRAEPKHFLADSRVMSCVSRILFVKYIESLMIRLVFFECIFKFVFHFFRSKTILRCRWCVSIYLHHSPKKICFKFHKTFSIERNSTERMKGFMVKCEVVLNGCKGVASMLQLLQAAIFLFYFFGCIIIHGT